jgi:hypothetical protein
MTIDIQPMCLRSWRLPNRDSSGNETLQHFVFAVNKMLAIRDVVA